MGINITADLKWIGDSERIWQVASDLKIWGGQLGLPALVVLLCVASKPGLSVNDLAAELGIPQQSASRAVAQLAGRYHTDGDRPPVEYVEQRVKRDDPRSRALFPTDAGREFVRRLCFIK